MTSFIKRTFAGAFLVGSMIGATVLAAPPANPVKTALPADAQLLRGADLYSHTLQGVALVVTSEAQGTAWVVDREKRLLFTNFHVIAVQNKAADQVSLVFPEFQNDDVIAERTHYLQDVEAHAVVGKVVAADPDRDLALIEAASLPDTAQALPMADKGVRAGDQVSSIGNPGASPALWVYNQGVVRSVYKDNAERIVETQNPLNPGDSGGPMVNDRGEVVAINVAVSRMGSLVSFGIDLSEMKTVLNDFRNGVTVKKDPTPAPKKANIAPNDADAAVARGEAARAAKQFDKAIAEYTAALKLDPKRLDALRGRAWVNNEIGQFAAAVEDCTTVLTSAPDDLFALRERVFANDHLKKFVLVIVDCDHFLKLQPGDGKILFTRGIALEAMGLTDKAKPDYAAALLFAEKGSDLEKAAKAKMDELNGKPLASRRSSEK